MSQTHGKIRLARILRLIKASSAMLCNSSECCLSISSEAKIVDYCLASDALQPCRIATLVHFLYPVLLIEDVLFNVPR